jgi:hypothetical protein
LPEFSGNAGRVIPENSGKYWNYAFGRRKAPRHGYPYRTKTHGCQHVTLGTKALLLASGNFRKQEEVLWISDNVSE